MFDTDGGEHFLSVKVGRGETTAKCFVESPSELRALLGGACLGVCSVGRALNQRPATERRPFVP